MRVVKLIVVPSTVLLQKFFEAPYIMKYFIYSINEFFLTESDLRGQSFLLPIIPLIGSTSELQNPCYIWIISIINQHQDPK